MCHTWDLRNQYQTKRSWAPRSAVLILDSPHCTCATIVPTTPFLHPNGLPRLLLWISLSPNNAAIASIALSPSCAQVVGDQYYTYAVCIMVITWFSIITESVEAHSNAKRLAEIAHYMCRVRARVWMTVPMAEEDNQGSSIHLDSIHLRQHKQPRQHQCRQHQPRQKQTRQHSIAGRGDIRDCHFRQHSFLYLCLPSSLRCSLILCSL
jgi:hypothetical protein